MFADDLIALKRRKPELEIRFITRVETKGQLSGIASRAVKRMKSIGIEHTADQELLHARMVVIDEQEVLVSSADLDVQQMDYEFNAGIWTNDPDVVAQAVRFYDNMLETRKAS